MGIYMYAKCKKWTGSMHMLINANGLGEDGQIRLQCDLFIL